MSISEPPPPGFFVLHVYKKRDGMGDGNELQNDNVKNKETILVMLHIYEYFFMHAILMHTIDVQNFLNALGTLYRVISLTYISGSYRAPVRV